MTAATDQARSSAADTGSIEQMLPAVVAALRVWDLLALELGDTVVVTGGHPWSPLAALVATWYGAVPVLLVKSSGAAPAGVTVVEPDDSGEQAQALANRLSGAPTVAALELSGRSDAVDLLLESLPKASRLMLAGSSHDRLTIDYYVNVHRKGLRLESCVFDDALAATAPASVIERARRLLARPERRAACAAALGR